LDVAQKLSSIKMTNLPVFLKLLKRVSAQDTWHPKPLGYT